MPLHIGEKCPKCGLGVMLHPRVYYYECTHCGYAYEIDPATRWDENPIRVIKKPFKGGKR